MTSLANLAGSAPSECETLNIFYFGGGEGRGGVGWSMVGKEGKETVMR